VVTSSTVSGWKWNHEQPDGALLKDGGGAPLVAARTPLCYVSDLCADSDYLFSA